MSVLGFIMDVGLIIGVIVIYSAGIYTGRMISWVKKN